MEYKTSATHLMNYQSQGSNSHNYELSCLTPVRDNFPLISENGLLIKYEILKFSSELSSDIVPYEEVLK
jgi:hypothetical protein